MREEAGGREDEMHGHRYSRVDRERRACSEEKNRPDHKWEERASS